MRITVGRHRYGAGVNSPDDAGFRASAAANSVVPGSARSTGRSVPPSSRHRVPAAAPVQAWRRTPMTRVAPARALPVPPPRPAATASATRPPDFADDVTMPPPPRLIPGTTADQAASRPASRPCRVDSLRRAGAPHRPRRSQASNAAESVIGCPYAGQRGKAAGLRQA